jgi:hypothetical protein
MLEENDEINWVAGYSALEAIMHDLNGRHLDGQRLGWWTDTELRNFKATANSMEVLGSRARHGKPLGLSEARMTSKDAGWLVRRIAAHWLTYLLSLWHDRPAVTSPARSPAQVRARDTAPRHPRDAP